MWMEYLEGVFPDAVDLVNDLHVARQQLSHHPDRPLLQSLWHDCVVGECKSLRAHRLLVCQIGKHKHNMLTRMPNDSMVNK